MYPVYVDLSKLLQSVINNSTALENDQGRDTLRYLSRVSQGFWVSMLVLSPQTQRQNSKSQDH